MKNVVSNNQIEFIYKWIRATRSPWKDSDQFRICWYFDEKTKDYIYEHKDELFRCNGFSISKGLAEQLPDELKERYFESSERGLLFIIFCSHIMNFVMGEKAITESDFINTFGLSKATYFSDFAQEEWENLIDY